MKALCTYLLLELKKGARLSLHTLGNTVAMLVILSAGFFLVSYFVFQSAVFDRLQVGMAIPQEEGEARLVSRFMSTMDSVKSICEFHYLEEKEALEKLEAGELQIVISLPESFYDDVYTGVNTPATVYFPYNSNLRQLVFRELLLDGVSILQTSESAVYAFLDVAKDRPLLVDADLLGDVIAVSYIQASFNRNKIFDETMLSSLGKLGIAEYYLASAFPIILLLCGLNYGFFYKKENRAAEQKLQVYGLFRWKIGIVKILVMTFYLWLVGIIFYIAGCVLSGALDIGLLWFDCRVLLYFIPLSLSIATFFHFIYRLAKDSMQGAVLLLILTIGMILCCGAVIPAAYLPETAAVLGRWMPLTFWNRYCTGTLFDTVGLWEIGVMAGIGVLTYGIGEVAAWRDL